MSAVPIPQLHYRRMRMADLPEVAHLEKSLYAFPWSIGNFRDSLTAGYDCWTVTHGETVIGYAVLIPMAFFCTISFRESFSDNVFHSDTLATMLVVGLTLLWIPIVRILLATQMLHQNRHRAS